MVGLILQRNHCKVSLAWVTQGRVFSSTQGPFYMYFRSIFPLPLPIDWMQTILSKIFMHTGVWKYHLLSYHYSGTSPYVKIATLLLIVHFFVAQTPCRGGGGGNPYNGLYREAPPDRLQVYKRVGISHIEVYKTVGKSLIYVFKRAFKQNISNRHTLWLYQFIF